MAHVLKTPEIPNPEARPDVRVSPPLVYMQPVWEYRDVVCAPGAAVLDEAQLNARGSEGWELVGVYTGADGVHFYFKRLAG